MSIKLELGRWDKCNKKWLKRIYYNCKECSIESNKLLRTSLKKFNFLCRKCATRKTCLDKYGVNHHRKLKSTLAKCEKTCLERYGVKNPSQSKVVKEKKSASTYKHYGVIHPSYSQNIIEKIQNTKRKNNSFNKSKQEEIAYELLKGHYSDVTRQYSDKRYPFACDFYIPEIDLFIECNFNWLHGKEPFDRINLQHIKKLKFWEEKSKDSIFYKKAIEVWTHRDPIKRQKVKDNKLNFIEFFKLSDLERNMGDHYECFRIRAAKSTQ